VVGKADVPGRLILAGLSYDANDLKRDRRHKPKRGEPASHVIAAPDLYWSAVSTNEVEIIGHQNFPTWPVSH